MLDHGRFGGKQIIPAGWVKQVLTPYLQPGQNVFYGYLWWCTLVKSPEGYDPSWMMLGNGGNIISIYRDFDAVIVVQSGSYNNDQADVKSFRIMSSLLKAMKPPKAASPLIRNYPR